LDASWLGICVHICVITLVAGSSSINNDEQHELQGVTFARTVGYQLHSYNDLREWTQALMKFDPSDSKHLKIDPSFQSAAWCQKLGTNVILLRVNSGSGCKYAAALVLCNQAFPLIPAAVSF